MKSPEVFERRKALRIEGEMAERVYGHDWSGTALGPVRQWSPCLRALVRMMLSSRFPMLIQWGPEFLTLYNDAFRPSLSDNGKHPAILGAPAREAWAEAWPTIGAMYESILAGGPAVYYENMRLPLYRDGVMGYAYWTYSYSPLTDDDGVVAGILVTCLETTQDVEHLEYFQ